MKPLLGRFAACLVGLSLVALGAGWVANTHAAGLKSDAKVKVTVKEAPATDKLATVNITLTIDKGWHIYANPVGLEDLASSQTVVSVEGTPKPEIVKIDYPPGKVVKDNIVGDHRVYEGEVTIKLQVRRGADSGPLTVGVKFQACDDKTCLQAALVKTTLP